jgi:uncharacterized protein (TIGR00730 family)
MQNIAVFCGSKFGAHADYENDVVALGSILGNAKKHIIYGGGKAGLMGTIAQNVMQQGGTVTGIIPKFLNQIERENYDITELIVTETMHERKQLLFGKADAAIVLPGGYGTLDELFEMLTWNQLELHQIKIFILNTNGFYNHLLAHIQTMKAAHFLYENSFTEIIVLKNTKAIEAYL